MSLIDIYIEFQRETLRGKMSLFSTRYIFLSYVAEPSTRTVLLYALPTCGLSAKPTTNSSIAIIAVHFRLLSQMIIIVS